MSKGLRGPQLVPDPHSYNCAPGQVAELAGLTRCSPVRDIVSNPVPVEIDVVRA